MPGMKFSTCSSTIQQKKQMAMKTLSDLFLTAFAFNVNTTCNVFVTSKVCTPKCLSMQATRTAKTFGSVKSGKSDLNGNLASVPSSRYPPLHMNEAHQIASATPKLIAVDLRRLKSKMRRRYEEREFYNVDMKRMLR